MAARNIPLIALFLFAPTTALPSDNIRVAIIEGQQTITLESPAGLMVSGRPQLRAEKKLIIKADSFGTRPLSVSSVDGIIRVNGRPYRGAVEIRKNGRGLLLAVNDLAIEDYLLGVVPREVPPDWEQEALKAQAVAARTFALHQKSKAGRKPYHLRANVLDQLYGGVSAEREAATRAVRETRGRIIVYEGKLIPAFYHSSCGGHTENAFELWGIDAPYLVGVDCDCQEISKYGVWEKRFPVSSLAFALGRIGHRVDGISGVAIDGVTPAGRVRNLSVSHAGGSAVVKAENLRAAIGYGVMPSVFFEAETKGPEVVFSGRGMGHGVGLCQWGARQMAQKGRDYLSILSHYYPGSDVIDTRSLR